MKIHTTNRRALLIQATALVLAPLAALAPPLARAQDQDDEGALDTAALTGVWRGIERTGGISIRGEVIFYDDGGYRRTHKLGYLETWDTGDVKVARNWIHFDVDDYEPKYYQGVFQHKPPSETWKVTRFDGRILEGWIGSATHIRYEKD